MDTPIDAHQGRKVATAGSLLVIVAPSGAGKTSLVRAMLQARDGIELSVSSTTRKPRPGERNGVDYEFLSMPAFEERRAQGDFIEWAKVHGNYYGTSRRWLASRREMGLDVVLEIDWQGARQIREHHPDAVSVFIAPPSIEVLRQRLVGRGQDAPEVIEQRLAAARSEIEHAEECQYVIINQDFAASCQALCTVVDAMRLRFGPQSGRHPELFRALGMA